MLTKQQRQDLALLNTEAASLTSKAKWTKQDEARFGYLKMAQAAVRDGMTLAELDAEQDEVRSGNANPTTRTGLTREQAENARMIQAIVEQRDVEGAPMLNHFGTYTGLGNFIETGFMPRVFETLKQHDILFDDAFCTRVITANGVPMTVPTMSDTENDAAVIGEAGTQTEVDIYAPGQATLGVYSFASRRWTVSNEAFQDLTGAFSASELFAKFTAKALARGIGRALLTGNGSSTILGLRPSLNAAAAPIVVAAGSAANDGSANTGANSLGCRRFGKGRLRFSRERVR
jgi:HK97 family phage major capsid protein